MQKDMFKNLWQAFREVFPWYLGITFIAAVLFSFVEAKNIFDSIWWAVTTGMTIGYGDIYPVTNAGRIIAAMLVFSTIFLMLPVYTGRFAARMVARDSFTHEEQEELKDSVKKILKNTERKDES